MSKKKIAICQPYFSPYLGYFQLINAVDVFVSYDDVNFIKGGWIHRNKLRVSNKEKLFNIPLIKQSSFKKINETIVNWNTNTIPKLMKTIELSYCKSEYKNEVLDILHKTFRTRPHTIADLSLKSIKEFCTYLDIDTEIKVSSLGKYQKTNDRVMNIINICRQENLKHYINPIGGMKLYDKETFKKYDMTLNFMQGIGSLSIIDVCMNESKEEIKEKLKNYTLI